MQESDSREVSKSEGNRLGFANWRMGVIAPVTFIRRCASAWVESRSSIEVLNSNTQMIPWQSLHTRHSRSWHENKFVYPVLSRRSQGISIGVNLNPDKVCNFDCIYCQVDRRSESETQFVEMPALIA